MSERESMPCDVVIIGGGVAGLAAAIRLKQINEDLEVVVLEKGSEIGAHILSGAVVDPRALDELLPEWRDMDCPMAETPVTENHHWVLSATGQSDLPEFLLPPFMGNHGNYTGSLGNLARWLGEQAEGLGVMVFPGFPAAEVLFDEQGAVTGVVTQDMGIAEDGSQKGDYQPGMEIHAKYTLFAEGARGNLTKKMKAKYDLEADCEPQVYGLGIKELWDIDPAKHEPGRVIHTQGWPLSETGTWGGGFLYHQANGQVALGFVTALDYKNPYVSPYQEFQRWKHHPDILDIIEGGKRVAYGARVINEGKLAMPVKPDVEISFIDTRDIGACAAEVLTEEGHNRRVYTLTGVRITLGEAINTFSQTLGRKIEFAFVPAEVARSNMDQHGMPEWMKEHFLGVGRLLSEGRLTELTDNVRRITGREPHDYASFVSNNATVFGG